MTLLTTAEAARRLGLHPRRVQALCAQGRLGQRCGKSYVISERELVAFTVRPRKPGRPRKQQT